VARLRERLFALADEGRPVIADLDQVKQPRARIPADRRAGYWWKLSPRWRAHQDILAR
jgi:hypothetical protein